MDGWVSRSQIMILTSIIGCTFRVDDAYQILNMGGPYVGTLGCNGKVISQNCIADNLLSDDQNERLYFVKYHSLTKWRSGVYFTINCYDSKLGQIYESKEMFNIIFLKQFLSGNKIEILEAFYDMPNAKRRVFDIGGQQFNSIS
jgi:hypothetical protein